MEGEFESFLVKDFRSNLNFKDRTQSNILFYSDVKILLKDGEVLYANACRLGAYTSFNNFFMEFRGRRGDEGFYSFQHPGMDEEIMWLPILQTVYSYQKKDVIDSTNNLFSYVDENYTKRISNYIGFLESMNLQLPLECVSYIFRKNLTRPMFKLWPILKQYYGRYRNVSGIHDKRPMNLEGQFLEGIVRKIKTDWTNFKSTCTADMKVFDEDDFKYACNWVRFKNTFSDNNDVLLQFLLTFPCEFLNKEEAMDLINLDFCSTKEITVICGRTILPQRAPKLMQRILEYLARNTRHVPPAKRAKP